MSSFLKEYEVSKVFMGKLNHDADLLEELTRICSEKNILSAKIEAIGAVKKARLAYYDQEKRKYAYFVLDQPLEIVSLIGNVSVRNHKPMVHAHLTLSDKNGKVFGGHLATGTILYAAEVKITVLIGEPLSRGFDEVTGLPLWEF